MTKEDAIELVKSAFDIWEDKYSVGNDMSREHKARDMAIKALEQEPILDKIRAEIMKLQTYKMFVGENTVYVERDDVLQIIDKYKEESEVQE